MIKKTRNKFFILITVILLVLYAIVSTTMFFILKKENANKNLAFLNTLFEISKTDSENIEEQFNYINGIIIKTTGIGKIFYYNKSFTEDMVQSVFDNALDKNVNVGMVDDFAFMFRDNTFVCFDASEFNTHTLNTFLRIIEAMGFLFILLELFSIFLTRKIVDPFITSIQKQKQFISNASHELNTPITIIQANSDILLSTDKHNKWILGIKDQTARMNSLIKDMLTLAKLDETTFKLEKKEFNVSDLVDNVLLSFDSIAFEEQKSILTSIEPNVLYYGDQNSFKKIVEILLENAIKYSDGKTDIKVVLEKREHKIIFTVLNSGSSVKPEEKNKIFERFFRGENSRNRRTGGSGLGLAIAKNIADYNKWKISAEIPKENFIKITLVI